MQSLARRRLVLDENGFFQGDRIDVGVVPLCELMAEQVVEHCSFRLQGWSWSPRGRFARLIPVHLANIGGTTMLLSSRTQPAEQAMNCCSNSSSTGAAVGI